MKPLARKSTLFLCLAAGLLFVCQGTTRLYAASQHNECISVTQGYLGDLTLTNVCQVPVDMKWCHMTTDGRNVGCNLERSLNAGWHVNTGACAQCT